MVQPLFDGIYRRYAAGCTLRRTFAARRGNQDTFTLPLAYAVSTTSADCRAKMPFVTTPGMLLMISSSLNGSVISR